MTKTLWGALLLSLALVACGDKKEEAPTTAADASDTEEKILNIYNWPDYIAESIVPDFEKQTGIKVNYQTFENNEVLHAKLVAGNSGYDLVVPTSGFAKSQIDAGFLQPLDKTTLSNYGNLDPEFMKKLEQVDPGNQYLIPWGWGFTTVGINRVAVEKALGSTPIPENAWELVFNPKYTQKLKSCGIAFLDSPTEVIPPALHYIGKDAYSSDPEDYKAAGEMLAKVRKDIRVFSSTLIDDLAGGRACVVLGWSGDINIAADRAKENGSGAVIEALLPSTGGVMFLDTAAITKDAKHPKNALAFLNYFLDAKVSALQTNEINYPTGNLAAIEGIAPELTSNTTIFLDQDNLAKTVAPGYHSNASREAMSNVYTIFKKGS